MKHSTVYLLCVPALVLVGLLLAAPLYSTVAATFGGEVALFGRYTGFFENEFNRAVFFRTLKIALLTTLIAAALGYPTAYFISQAGARWRSLFILCAVLPLLTSSVVRSFSWIVILGRKGSVNTLLMKLHVIDTPLRLLFNEISVVIGLTYLFLPLMILSLVGVMENIEDDLMDAATSLGAPRIKAFFAVIVPLSLPGLVVGVVLVFTGSLTSFTTPQLLGGDGSTVLSTLIFRQAMVLFDWSGAATIATIMVVLTLSVIMLVNMAARRLNPAN